MSRMSRDTRVELCEWWLLRYAVELPSELSSQRWTGNEINKALCLTTPTLLPFAILRHLPPTPPSPTVDFWFVRRRWGDEAALADATMGIQMQWPIARLLHKIRYNLLPVRETLTGTHLQRWWKANTLILFACYRILWKAEIKKSKKLLVFKIYKKYMKRYQFLNRLS